MAATSPNPSPPTLSSTTVFAAHNTTTSTALPSDKDFAFPTYTSFPPFYTLQPNLQTRARQLELWASLILSYAAYNRRFRFSLSAMPTDLFTNAVLKRSLKPADIRVVLEHMSQPSNGGHVEFLPPQNRGDQSNTCYVWWKSATEWAEQLHAWVDQTGQKGVVLTMYELREGEATEEKAWKGMDEGMLRKVLAVLVKRGKAQIFGQTEGEGVKFF